MQQTLFSPKSLVHQHDLLQLGHSSAAFSAFHQPVNPVAAVVHTPHAEKENLVKTRYLINNKWLESRNHHIEAIDYDYKASSRICRVKGVRLSRRAIELGKRDIDERG